MGEPITDPNKAHIEAANIDAKKIERLEETIRKVRLLATTEALTIERVPKRFS